MGEKKVFKNKLHRNIFIAAGTSLLVFVCLFCLNIFFFSPKAVLTRSLTALGTEWAELQYGNKPIETKSSINVTATAIDSKYSTVGMDMKIHSDVAKKILEAETELSISNVSIVEGKICVDEDRLFIEVPKLLTEKLYVDLDTLGADYNKSAWAEWSGVKLPQDFSISVFGEKELGDNSEDNIKQYIAELAKVYADMEVEKKENEILKVSGKNVKCTHLVATMKKEALNELSVLKEKDMQFAEDVQLEFYLDQKQRVLQMLSDDLIVMEAKGKQISVDLFLEFDEKTENKFSFSIEKFNIYKEGTCILKITGKNSLKAYEREISVPEEGLDLMELAPSDMKKYWTDSIKKIEEFFSGL